MGLRHLLNAQTLKLLAEQLKSGLMKTTLYPVTMVSAMIRQRMFTNFLRRGLKFHKYEVPKGHSIHNSPRCILMHRGEYK